MMDDELHDSEVSGLHDQTFGVIASYKRAGPNQDHGLQSVRMQQSPPRVSVMCAAPLRLRIWE